MKTFSEFLAEASVMPTWGEMNKTPAQQQKDSQHRAFEKKASQAHVMPTFAELVKKRKEGMSEAEILEFIGNFFKKKTDKPFKPQKASNTDTVGHGDKAYRTSHSYNVGDDIDPKTVPVFKPSWQTSGR